MEKIKDYFKRYPNSEEVYENGGKLFHKRGAAESYGKTETKKYTRKEAAASPNSSEGGSDGASEKETATILLNATEDIAALDYNMLKKLAKHLGLSVADQKSETLIAALEEFKKTLNPE